MKKRLQLLCELAAASALFAIMALTFFDVLGRKLLDRSITGSLELTELLMVAVIFAGLPLVSARGEHVEFDSLDALLPPRVRKVQAACVHLFCAVLLLGLGGLMWKTGRAFYDTGETTAQLGILKAPFIHGMAILSGLAGIVHLLRAWKPDDARESGQGTAL
jgi:TRAP-type C4-dicarboxylate transport system permease small subunit